MQIPEPISDVYFIPGKYKAGVGVADKGHCFRVGDALSILFLLRRKKYTHITCVKISDDDILDISSINIYKCKRIITTDYQYEITPQIQEVVDMMKNHIDEATNIGPNLTDLFMFAKHCKVAIMAIEMMRQHMFESGLKIIRV